MTLDLKLLADRNKSACELVLIDVNILWVLHPNMLEETLGRLELSDTCYTLIDRFNFVKCTGFILAILILLLWLIA